MKVKEMTFSKSMKVKAPNFGPQGDVHYSITIEVEKEDDITKVADMGWQDVDYHIETQVKDMMRNLGIAVSE